MIAVAGLLTPSTQSVPCTTKLKDVTPLATGMSSDAPPTVAASGASSSRDASLDVR